MSDSKSATTATGCEGNTSRSRKKDTQSRKWCFTINNYDSKDEKYLRLKFQYAKYVVGREVAPETKTPHLQGYVEYKCAVRFSTMKKRLPRAHIEKARGSTRQNYDYCTKGGDFFTNIDFRTFRQKLKDKKWELFFKNGEITWKPWQKQVLELVNNVDSRTIHWFWEPDGNVGKSFVCEYMAYKMNAIKCDGKKSDIFNQVNTMIENGKEPELIICDMPRTAVNYINYTAIESLKQGFIYSGKYEGGMCHFMPPLVICFANRPPDIDAVSHDRWNIVRIE